ncbi:MAG: sugar nucleotide-binding protein [Puniceicoccales bacterium]|jgi:UDP-glucose 4,6-dehydratase/3,5-epimerase/4-reductase|nr:sugar nucleotide-binding protein [Puniceicoccales bacterium]
MIVVLGASGYVGQAYAACLRAKGVPFVGLSRSDVDYTKQETLTAFLKETRPEFLINAAGYTGKPNVDACEKDKANCLQGNAVLPGAVRAACTAAAIPWGHVSSGCIFSGTRPDGQGFSETDAPNFSFRQNNCSFYSGTKALGEEVLGYGVTGADETGVPQWNFLEGEPNGYIWRLRIPFDNKDNPRNYLTKLMRYESLLDATNSLSQLGEFVRATLECWEKRVPAGIYNVTNPGSISTHEVVALIEETGVCRKKFQFFKDEADFMRSAAKTPRSNCVLRTDKLRDAGIRMSEVHDAIRQALREWAR